MKRLQTILQREIDWLSLSPDAMEAMRTVDAIIAEVERVAEEAKDLHPRTPPQPWNTDGVYLIDKNDKQICINCHDDGEQALFFATFAVNGFRTLLKLLEGESNA